MCYHGMAFQATGACALKSFSASSEADALPRELFLCKKRKIVPWLDYMNLECARRRSEFLWFWRCLVWQWVNHFPLCFCSVVQLPPRNGDSSTFLLHRYARRMNKVETVLTICRLNRGTDSFLFLFFVFYLGNSELVPLVWNEIKARNLKETDWINIIILSICFKRPYGICLNFSQVMSLLIR